MLRAGACPLAGNVLAFAYGEEAVPGLQNGLGHDKPDAWEQQEGLASPSYAQAGKFVF